VGALEQFAKQQYDPQKIHQHAQQFNQQFFTKNIQNIIKTALI
jgi:hypothetical protein